MRKGGSTRRVLLFVKVEETPNKPVDVGRGRIRCPKCQWQPRQHDRWMCRCSHEWNTFETGGVCPACRFRWRFTACLNCHQWSAHEDWYEKPDP